MAAQSRLSPTPGRARSVVGLRHAYFRGLLRERRHLISHAISGYYLLVMLVLKDQIVGQEAL